MGGHVRPERPVTFKRNQRSTSLGIRRELREYLRRHGRMPANRKGWRTWCTDGVVQLLQFTHVQWPPTRPARSPFELLARTLCEEYRRWLEERRALAPRTIEGTLEEARHFPAWYGLQFRTATSLELSLPQIDAYAQVRATGIRRTTLKCVFVGGGRNLHTSGGRKLHSQAGLPLRKRTWSGPCTDGSNECCYVTICSKG